MAAQAGPTALVLTGGGARGAYQAGVLAGIADRAGADVGFPIVTGVSAGGINAAGLAAYRGDLRKAAAHLCDAWSSLSVDQVFHSSFAALTWSFLRWAVEIFSGGVAPGELRGLLDTEPLRESLKETIHFPGIGANLESGRLKALALSATEYSTGRTVTFVHGGEDIPDWTRARRASSHEPIGVDHVMASAALPLIFPAVKVGDSWFGDGSIRHSAPLAPAIHLGARRILAVSVRYSPSEAERSGSRASDYPPPAQILGMLMHGVFIDALENDAERAARINRTLSVVPEQEQSPDKLRPVDIHVLRPSQDLGKLAAELEAALPHSLRVLARGLGVHAPESSDFLSYLLFERPYLERLIELGREDVKAQWDEVEPLLERADA